MSVLDIGEIIFIFIVVGVGIFSIIRILKKENDE